MPRGCRGATAAARESLPEVADATAAPDPAGGVSIEVELPQLPPGHQLAWCRAYDVAARRGVLVDLHTKREWEVEVADLSAPADGASLFVGEFVEYLPSAAQQAVEATAQGGGAERPTGWVRGLMGWPLMCQALGGPGVDQGAEVATSTGGVLR